MHSGSSLIAADSGSDRVQGGGEMGVRVRALDWSKTPLGPIGRWPQSLRSPLSMMLSSKAQIILFWGPQYVVFYNDAYRPVFGAKHPDMLGMPGCVAWSEIWDSGANLHALLDGVVRTGEAFSASDLLFVIERYGFHEETYFDVSYDPVRDESGAVAGVFCIVTETTGRVVGGRRLALLKDLAAHNSTARTPHDACVLAIETLTTAQRDIVFALAYLDGELQACTPGAPEALADAKEQQVMWLPLPSGKLVVGLNPRRPFDDLYRSFVHLAADQVAAAVVNARAYDAERKRAEALAEIDRAKTAFFSNVSHELRTPPTLLGPLEDLLASVPVVESPAVEPSRRATRIAGQRILVVDDNVDAAESLGALLRCLGAEVVTVHDGPAALEALRTEKPCAAVLDIGMPGMDGYEVARRVRAGPRGEHIQLIALTGWGTDEDRRRSREAGIDHHLVKPVDLKVLESLLAARREEPRASGSY